MFCHMKCKFVLCYSTKWAMRTFMWHPRMLVLMVMQMKPCFTCIRAVWTFKWPFSTVLGHVKCKYAFCHSSKWAMRTFMWPHPRMLVSMAQKMTLCCSCKRAVWTLIRLFPTVLGDNMDIETVLTVRCKPTVRAKVGLQA